MNRSSVGSIDKRSKSSWSSTSCEPGRADALDDEIEFVGSALDAVVVDRHAQVLAAAGLARLQSQHARGRRESRCVARVARLATRTTTAVSPPCQKKCCTANDTKLKVLWPPKTRLNSSKALDDDGLVQRPALGATDERDDGRRDYRYDFSTVWRHRRSGAEVERFGRHSARASEKRLHDSWRRQRLQHDVQRVVTPGACVARARTNESATRRRRNRQRGRRTRPRRRRARRATSSRVAPANQNAEHDAAPARSPAETASRTSTFARG